MDWFIKGHQGVEKRSDVVHSDNDEESLYACCCTQKVTVKGCHRCSILAVTVHEDLHEVQWINCKGMLLNLIKAKSAIFTFLSKFNAVQMKSSPSWTLNSFQIINSNSFQLLDELIHYIKFYRNAPLHSFLF